MADKKSRDKPLPASSTVMSFPQPPLKNAQEYLKAYTGYAYTAISAIAQEVASIQLKLFETKFIAGKPERNPIYEHEVLSLLQFVNELTTFYDLVESTQVYLELTGEAFWVVLRDGETGPPREIWMVRPDWVKIVTDPTDIIKHYTYHPGGEFNEKVIIPKENMIHFKYFNPLNPYRGKGSIQAAALPLDTHTFAQEYNRNFFFNSAIPSLIFTTEKKMNAASIKRFVEQWQQTYGGRAKSNKVAFLGGGFKLDKVNAAAKEMDFKEQQKMMRDDVLAVFKVPKTVLGMVEDVNRANALATTLSFMERVITPRMRKFVGHLNEFLLPMYGELTTNIFFDFVDPAPEDEEQKLKKYENSLKYGWMTPNEVRAEENLEPLEGGDELAPSGSKAESEVPEPEEDNTEKTLSALGAVFSRGSKKETTKKVVKKVKKQAPKEFKHMMPMPVKRLDEVQKEKFESDLSKDVSKLISQMLEDNGKKKKVVKKKKKQTESSDMFTDTGKDAYWRQFIDFVDEREEELLDITIRLFEEQEKVILENLEQVKYWKMGSRKGKEASILQTLDDMMKTWLGTFTPILREIMITQGSFVLDFLGTGGTLDTSTETAVNFLRNDSATLIKEINKTTRQALRETLALGFGEGESITALRNRVMGVFKIAKRSRATMIARTEALRASNFASVEAYRQSGVVQAKEWLAERDGRLCPWCESMDGKIIGLDKNYFNKGDSLTVDDSTIDFKVLAVKAPPLHPNCRCTTIPVLIGS